MAGIVVPSIIAHRSRGVVRTDVDILCDASGNATAAVVGVGFGKLVGVLLRPGTLDFSNTIISIADAGSGKVLLAYDTLATATAKKFASTTTGDDTGGTTEDVFSTGAVHGLHVNDTVVFLTQTGGTLPTVGTTYYVSAVESTSKFNLSATAPTAATGAANVTDIDMGGDISASTWVKTTLERPWAPITGLAGTVTGVAATGLFTASAAHDLAIGDKIKFTALTGGSALAIETPYYVTPTTFAATTFTLAATRGGADLLLGSTVTAAVFRKIVTDSPHTYGDQNNATMFRPTTNITIRTGAGNTAVTPATTAVDVNRDIFLGGKVTVGVAQGGNLGAGTISLIVDESIQQPDK